MSLTGSLEHLQVADEAKTNPLHGTAECPINRRIGRVTARRT